MKEIILSQGKVTKVDDADFDWLNQWKWQAVFHDVWYAARHDNSLTGRPLIKMHCLIMGTVDKEILIDHEDRDGLNNQRYNLREATHAQNAWNRKAIESASLFKGVSLMTSRGYKYWRARIGVNNKRIDLGGFPYTDEGEIAAAKAYDQAAMTHHKEFAHLNFPLS